MCIDKRDMYRLGKKQELKVCDSSLETYNITIDNV